VNPAIDICPDDAAIVMHILDQHVPNVEVLVFGSRATGKARKYSDLDIVLVVEKILPLTVLAALEAALEESELPFKVDVVEFASVAPHFRSIIEKTAKPLRV
jgi:type I restriction enzyme S subunit